MPISTVALSYFLFAMAGRSQTIRSLKRRKEKTHGIESGATDEAMDRKAPSDTRLAAEQVAVNPHLPAIKDTLHAARHRASRQRDYRTTALRVAALKGEELERAAVDDGCHRTSVPAANWMRTLRDSEVNYDFGNRCSVIKHACQAASSAKLTGWRPIYDWKKASRN